MAWHEDFEDEPSVENQMPFGISPEEMHVVMMDAMVDACECCGVRLEQFYLVETGTYEFYTMDIDPGTLMCVDCLEDRREQYTPDDPELFDALTRVSVW